MQNKHIPTKQDFSTILTARTENITESQRLLAEIMKDILQESQDLQEEIRP